MPYRKGPAGTAEKLHSELVRARGACQRCGSRQALECAHIIRRRFVATRTDETNAWCLCRDCHRIVDQDPAAFVMLLDETLDTNVYLELYRRAHDNTKVWYEKDWKAETKRLRARLNEARAQAQEAR